MGKGGKVYFAVIQYVLSIAIAVALLLHVFQKIEFEEFIEKWESVDFSWVYLSIFLSFIAFVARAYRWNLLIEPLGYKLKTWRTLIAVFVGYLVNLAVPRAGELSRCAILKKNDGVPVSQSFGTVVMERIFDFLMLLMLLILGFVLEFEKLITFFEDILTKLSIDPRVVIFIGIGAILFGALFLIFFNRIDELLIKFKLYLKVKGFIRELLTGLMSFSKMQNKTGFIISTLIIWVTYFYMGYVIVFALEETSSLTHLAGLTMLVGAGIALSIPIQAGFGTYHFIVSRLLLLYSIPEATGTFFATLLHTSQIATIAVLGAISLVISFLIRKRTAAYEQSE